MKQQEIQQLINKQESIILDRKAKLAGTDYIAVKIAEGSATKAEYENEIAERQQWRGDINTAQEEIARLKAIEPEDEANENRQELNNE